MLGPKLLAGSNSATGRSQDAGLRNAGSCLLASDEALFITGQDIFAHPGQRAACQLAERRRPCNPIVKTLAIPECVSP